MSVKKNDELINTPKVWYEIIKGYNEKEKIDLSILASIFSEEVTLELFKKTLILKQTLCLK
nr:hypothetical protein [Mycoplasmopsis bovis]